MVVRSAVRAVAAMIFVLGVHTLHAEPAASEAGGLPAVSDRVTVLETSVTQLSTLVTTLQTKITVLENSSADFTKAIADLKTALTAETNARLALQQFTNALDTYFSGKIASLESGLAAETNARIAADQSLNALIAGAGAAVYSSPPLASFLPNGDETVLASLALPAGNYVLIGKALVGSLDVSHDWNCRMLLDGQQELDHAFFLTEDTGFGAYSSAYIPLVLTTAASLPNGGTVTVQCHTGDPSSFVRDIKFVGVRVGAIN